MSRNICHSALQERLSLSTTEKWKPLLPVRVIEGLDLFDAENDEPMLKKLVKVMQPACS